MNAASGDGDTAAEFALLVEAVGHVRPMRIVVRRIIEGLAADLVGIDGHVALADYGTGLSKLHSVEVPDGGVTFAG